MLAMTATGPGGGRVVGLLLASGFGRRFDAGGRRNKLLARLPDGGTVVAASARALCEALEHVVVVVPDRGHLVEAALSDLPVHLVRNPRAREGIGASIAVGVAALKARHPDAVGWLVALGDMPFIAPRTIRTIADAVAPRDGETAATSRIVAAAYEGRRGHPVAFSRELDASLVALDGDHGAGRIVDAHAVRLVECDDPGVLRDIDTPADLASARRDDGAR